MAKGRKEGNIIKSSGGLRQELVRHFRDIGDNLRRQWVQEMKAKELLSGLTEKETETESKVIYDTCISCLETGRYDSAETYAKRTAERDVLRAMTPEQFLGGMLTLRDVYERSLFEKFKGEIDRLYEFLAVYEPVANRILSIVALAFIEERERVIRRQQTAILELSTPVLQLRHGLLILPIVGIIDSKRARQLTEQLLKAIRTNRAKVAIIDITGVPAVDSKVANHILQTVDAVRLMGARAIITGLSPEIAQTVVAIGVDLGRVFTLSDLQSGIEEADRILGYKIMASRE